MPRPTSATTIQRPDLGQVAYEYMLGGSERGFIGMQIMPVFPVDQQSADYPVIPVESLLKLPTTDRAPRSKYSRGDWEFESGTYATKEYGWEEPIDDVERALYQRFFDAETVASEIAVDHILRGHEKRVAEIVQDTSLAVASANIVNEWDDAANATPHADVTAAKKAMRAASGVSPNAIVMSKTVFDNVMATSEIKTYLQYTSPHLVMGEEAQRQTLARYFGLDRVLVGDAMYDSAKSGQAASLTDLWSNEYVSLVRISAGGNRLKEPVLGRTFLWTADSPTPVVTESYREEDIRSDVIRVRQNTDEAIIFTGALYILGNATT